MSNHHPPSYRVFQYLPVTDKEPPRFSGSQVHQKRQGVHTLAGTSRVSSYWPPAKLQELRLGGNIGPNMPLPPADTFLSLHRDHRLRSHYNTLARRRRTSVSPETLLGTRLVRNLACTIRYGIGTLVYTTGLVHRGSRLMLPRPTNGPGP